VPWSVPIFALTCLKHIDEVIPFDLMGDEHGTVDKIYLQSTDQPLSHATSTRPFNMQYQEKHLQQLYQDFPLEHRAIDEFIVLSNRAMMFVKFFLFSRLLPRYELQHRSIYIELISLRDNFIHHYQLSCMHTEQ